MADDVAPPVLRRRGIKNRPGEAAWKQQKLPAFRPIYTAKFALLPTLVVGVIFLSVGLILHFINKESKEIIIDYTDCVIENGTRASEILSNSRLRFAQLASTTCKFSVFLSEEFSGQVKFYYGLKGFYQNARLYVQSRNDLQVFGNLDKVDGCDPGFATNELNESVPIAPCGHIANSMFNDSFELYYLSPGDPQSVIPVPFTTKGIVSQHVVDKKFKNPPEKPGEDLCDAFRHTAKPPWWQKKICELGDNKTGRGFLNVDLIEWMSPAALPHFRKSYRFLDRNGSALFGNGLPMGEYSLTITYNYPVDAFEGNKSFIITSESWLGPRNTFLSVAYLTVGVLLLLLCLVLVGILLRERLVGPPHSSD